jgi:hypothetical protein
MADEEKENEEEIDGIPKLKVLYQALPPEVKGTIAFLLMCILFIPTAAVFVPMALEKRCWEFQAKDHRFFKFNSCNGDVFEITEEYLEKARVKSGQPN